MAPPGGNLDDIMNANANASQKVNTLVGETEAANKAIQRLSQTLADYGKVVSDVNRKEADLIAQSKKAAELNERVSAGLKSLFSSAITGAAGLTNKLDEMGVAATKFGSVWNNAFGQGNKTFTQVVEKSQNVAIQLRELARQGKITYDELQGLGGQAAKLGVDFEKVLTVLDNNKGLRLVNQGFLELDEAMNLTGNSLKLLGASSDQATNTLLATASAIERVQLVAGRGVLSTHQLAQEVGVLQEQFKYLGVDAERLPGVIAAFSVQAAKARKDGKTWSPSGAVAAEIGTSFVSDMAKMSPERSSFFGQMGGMGGGLAAGVRFQELMRKDIGGAAGSMMKTIQNLSGAGFVSGAQVVGAKNPAEAERLAELREQQIQIVQETTGRNREDAMGLVEAGAGGGLVQALSASKDTTAADGARLQANMARDTTEVKNNTQTVATRFEKFTDSYMQQAASYRDLVQDAAAIAVAIDVGKKYWPYLETISMLLTGNAIGEGLFKVFSKSGGIKALFGMAEETKVLSGAGLKAVAGTALGAAALGAATAATVYKSYETLSNRSGIVGESLSGITGRDNAGMNDEANTRKGLSPLQRALMRSSTALGGLTSQFGSYGTAASNETRLFSHGDAGVAQSASDTALGGLTAVQSVLNQLASGKQVSADQLKSIASTLSMQRAGADSSLKELQANGPASLTTTAIPSLKMSLNDLDEAIRLVTAAAAGGQSSGPSDTSNTGDPSKNVQTVHVEVSMKDDMRLHAAVTGVAHSVLNESQMKGYTSVGPNGPNPTK